MFRNVQIRSKTFQNVHEHSNMFQNMQIRSKIQQGENETFQNVPNRSKMQQSGNMFQNVPKCNCFFSGEEIRVIFRRLLVKTGELANACKISQTQLSRYLKMEMFSMEIAKKLAAMIGLSTSEEMQEYYDNIKEL